MTPRTAIPVLLTAAVAFSGCADGPVTPEQTDSPLFAKATNSTAVVVTLPGFVLVPGASSKITRTSSGATATLHTSDLTPGNAYTMWMVVFNVPGECATTPCGESDVAPGTAAVVDVVYVAGNVVGSSGQGTFSGRRAAGDNSKSLFAQLGAPDPGLIDPRVAEMHLIVRDHGPAIPGQIPSQLQTFEGACTAGSSFGLGSGANECADVQASVHESP